MRCILFSSIGTLRLLLSLVLISCVNLSHAESPTSYGLCSYIDHNSSGPNNNNEAFIVEEGNVALPASDSLCQDIGLDVCASIVGIHFIAGGFLITNIASTLQGVKSSIWNTEDTEWLAGDGTTRLVGTVEYLCEVTQTNTNPNVGVTVFDSTPTAYRLIKNCQPNAQYYFNSVTQDSRECSQNCPAGQIYNSSLGICEIDPASCEACGIQETDDPQIEDPCVGNPCYPATGNKYQFQSDYSNTDNSLSISRAYNSSTKTDTGFGFGWTLPFLKSLVVSSESIIAVRPSGRTESFTKDTNTGDWVGNNDSKLSLTEGIGFTIAQAKGGSEVYSSIGLLLSETTPSNRVTTYSYDANDQIVTIGNHFGHINTFTWDANGHIQTATNAESGVYTYSYANDNLISVLYPDGATRTYHYEDVSFPHHLTGITDENNVRFATFSYDEIGRVISTEHPDIGGGGAQEKFEIDYVQE